MQTFTLKKDKKTPAELLKAGKYDYVGDYAKQFVNSDEFRVSKDKANVDITLLEFDHDPSSEEVLERMKKEGLKEPTEEDALRFAAKYPEEQRKHPIVFLHKPWRGPDGDRGVLILSLGGSHRKLFCNRFGSGWDRHFVFAARVPRKYSELKFSALESLDTLTFESRISALEATVEKLTGVIKI